MDQKITVDTLHSGCEVMPKSLALMLRGISSAILANSGRFSNKIRVPICRYQKQLNMAASRVGQ